MTESLSKRPRCDLHDYIRAGTCPRCKEAVVDGVVRATDQSRNVPTLWNVSRIIALFDQDHDQEEVIGLLLSLSLHVVNIRDLLPILRKALKSPLQDVRWFAATDLGSRGLSISQEEADRVENELKQAPDDLAGHLLLIAYHAPRASLVESSRIARHGHIRWVMEKEPEFFFRGGGNYLDPSIDGDVYFEIAQRWLAHLDSNPNDLQLLQNAAKYFYFHNINLCIELLTRAYRSRPNDPDILDDLIDAHWRAIFGLTGESRVQAARHALSEVEGSLQGLSSGWKRWLILLGVANIAFEAEDLNKVRTLTTMMLGPPGSTVSAKSIPNVLEIPHKVYLFLGRLALRGGQIDLAKDYLLRASAYLRDSFLQTGGPSMILAKELLALGEREAVIEYLRRCSTSWETTDHRAEQWIYILEQGGTPDFGNNLLW